MAAPSSTTWGSTIGGYGRIGLYITTSNSNTQTTVTVQTWFWSKYSVSDVSNTLYFDFDKSSATTSKGSINIQTTYDSGSGWSTTNQLLLRTEKKTYSRSTSSQSKTCSARLTGVERVGGTMSVSAKYTIPALNSYTVTYNANGGSRAPSSQKKYYGRSLTLSSTKPTKTGYTFSKWNTKSNGTGTSYNPGSTYTSNASVTLYAIWKANTYTVTYNANGGSGAPSKQTKIYGVNLTISSTKPTRTGYTFLGWATTSTGSVAYQPSSTYTKNASITLYAVWSIIKYSVTFNAKSNGGKITPDNLDTKTYQVNYGSVLSTIPIASKNNYEFLGWYTATSGGTKFDKTEKIYSNKTFYAQFKLLTNCYIKINGIYKKAMFYKKIDGVYKTGTIYTKTNGTYKKVIE